MDFQVQVEKTSSIVRKLTIKVPAKVVDNRFQIGLNEVQKTAKIKGFRPGHIPMTLVKQQFGADVRHQVFHNLIDEYYQKAVLDQKLQAVGNPKIDTPEHQTGAGAHDHTLTEGKDLTFTAIVEVVPEIEVKGYTGISVSKLATEVTDEDVTKVINNILSAHAALEVAPTGQKVQKGDFVDMTFEGGILSDKGYEARPDMSGTRLLEVGSNALIDGFEDHLVGLSKGDTKTFKIQFPKDFYEKDMASKDAQFTVNVNEVKLKKLPALDDEFAQQVNFENLADMKAKTKEQTAKEKAQEADRKLRSDLIQAVLDKNTFEVPESLVQSQTRYLAQDVAQNLKAQGFNDQMIQEALMTELEGLKARAVNQVKASLLLEAIAKKENLTVTDAEIEAEITKMAQSMKMESDKVKQYYAQPRNRADLEFRLREEKTLVFLIGAAKVKTAK